MVSEKDLTGPRSSCATMSALTIHGRFIELRAVAEGRRSPPLYVGDLARFKNVVVVDNKALEAWGGK